MYKTDKISPSDLHLDEENPRFRISVNPSQEDIRAYMLMHEDVLKLAAKMSEMNTVLPGERVIIFKDGNKSIVLEGNRRTCAYQLFLDRSLIPQQNIKSFPKISESFLQEISEIDVDVVNTREEAMAYLAARHIEGVKTWSSVSKWRISYEYYKKGKDIKEIASTLVLPVAKIRTFIYDYKILLRGLKEENWNEEERRILNPLDIKPDKLIRLFHLSETTKELGAYFNDEFELKSSFISDEGLDKIIHILTRKAFIDNTINTRTKYSDIEEDIKGIVESYKTEEMGSGNDAQDESSQGETGNGTSGGEGTVNVPEGGSKEDTGETGDNRTKEGTTGGSENGTSGGKGAEDTSTRGNGSETSGGEQNGTGSGGKKNLPYFFQGIDYGHLDPNDPDTHGIARACREVQLFSARKMVDSFPMSAAFLTRSVIEHSIIYYAKKHNVQGQNKLIWIDISRNNSALKLSDIIKKFKTNLSNYILDKTMRQYFVNLFDNYEDHVDPLNWVVHRPDEFQLDPETLVQLPRRGLLSLINYLIKK